MGVLADDTGKPRFGMNESYNSGFTGLLGYDGSRFIGVPFPNSKYYDLYKTSVLTTACNNNECFGHGLSETDSWYNDTSSFISVSYPWIERGGIGNKNSANIFLFKRNYGSNIYGGTDTFRITIVNLLND